METLLLVFYFALMPSLFIGIHCLPYGLLFICVHSILKKIMIPTQFFIVLSFILVFLHILPLLKKIETEAYHLYVSGEILFSEFTLKAKEETINFLTEDSIGMYLLDYSWEAFVYSLLVLMFGYMMAFFLNLKEKVVK